EPLAFLLGTWSGRGRGYYPTIEPFEYEETITFAHIGKPFLTYAQRTASLADGRPLHAETGYWRPPRRGWVEVVLAHPNGLVEVSEGPFADGHLALASSAIGRTGTAKDVSAVQRDILLSDHLIRYVLRMAAMGTPMTDHLEAELARQA